GVWERGGRRGGPVEGAGNGRKVPMSTWKGWTAGSAPAVKTALTGEEWCIRQRRILGLLKHNRSASHSANVSWRAWRPCAGSIKAVTSVWHRPTIADSNAVLPRMTTPPRAPRYDVRNLTRRQERAYSGATHGARQTACNARNACDGMQIRWARWARWAAPVKAI